MGFSPIIRYNIKWDLGTSQPMTDLTTSQSTSYTISSGISDGNTYNFEITAENMYDVGPISTTNVLAAGVPEQISPVIIDWDDGTSKVTFDWSAPGT